MSRTRTSFALLGLGLGALGWIAGQSGVAAAQATSASADKNAAEKTPAADSGKAKPAAADSGKAKPAVADGGAAKPKVAKKSKKAKAKEDAQTTAAANEPPVPAGTAAADAAAKPKGGMPTVREANATPVATTGDPNAVARTPATKPKPAAPTNAATASNTPAATTTAAANTATAPGTAPAPKPTATPVAAAAKTGPKCTLDEPEQPRGGRLDVVGTGFGASPLVRVAGKPVRMIERREDRISVQVPADSDGGMVAVQAQGVLQPCGNLVIIGKNR